MKDIIVSAVAIALLSACTTTPPATEPAATPTSPPVRPTAPTIDPGDGGTYQPVIDPAGFTADVTNPYLPLHVGARWKYRERTPDGVEVTRVVVLPKQRTIMGIPATVVRDTVTIRGRLVEDTHDWYAQDTAGNVWYLGEDTTEYEDGKAVTTAGSWKAGVARAQPGIIMPAEPQVGQVSRQEYLPGEAEDMMQVVSVDETVTALGTTYTDVLQTKEWTPLEPKVVELKEYVRGVGQVNTTTVTGGSGRARLVSYVP